VLHLRLLLPDEHTEPVLDLLRDRVGVANLAVLRGCSVRPAGDVVIADLARETADVILDELRDRDIDKIGTITLDTIDTSVSVAAERAEEEAPGDGSDAVIWEQVVRQTYAESALSVTFVAFLTIAILIAECAIILDSAVLVVGAMVLGPEFSALAAIAVGVVHRRPRVLRRGLHAFAVGFAVAILISTLLALLARAFGWIDVSLLTASRPQTGFIVQPDKWTIVVGFLAGIAGVLSLTADRTGALVGVFISVVTVPAAANVALAVALTDGSEFRRALLQFAANIVVILLGGMLTLLVQQKVWHRIPKAMPTPAGPHHP